MPTETIKSVVDAQPWVWGNRMLWSFVTMFVLGSMARTFVSDEPFDPKKFAGEIIFSIIGAVMMYSLGMMQNMNEVQIIGFGAFASLGGVRGFEWAMRIAKKIKLSGALSE
jgi:hypothetical protein